MKKYITLLILIANGIACLTCNAQSHKRNFTYSYDGMGNRTGRTYALLACPTCRTAKQDSAKLLDSLLTVAQSSNIQLPAIPTEKVKFDGSLELKNIYPNPTQGNFVVEFTDIAIDANVKLLDVQGNKMDELILSGREWQLDISLFPAGNYILIIRTKEGRLYTKKIVKI